MVQATTRTVEQLEQDAAATAAAAAANMAGYKSLPTRAHRDAGHTATADNNHKKTTTMMITGT